MKIISRSQHERYEDEHDIGFTSLLKLLNAFDISLEEEFFKERFDENQRIIFDLKNRIMLLQPNSSMPPFLPPPGSLVL